MRTHSRISAVTGADWRLGVQALLAAACLAGMASAYANPLPLAGAAAVAAYAVLVPFRLPACVWGLRGQAAKVARRLPAFALLGAAGLLATAAADSPSPLLMAAGTLVLLALIVGFPAVLAWQLRPVAVGAWCLSGRSARVLVERGSFYRALAVTLVRTGLRV